MASLTPGVLSKLLDNAKKDSHPPVSGHRSALLQVTEIVPSLSGNPENPWQSQGFFLKVSDSLHSTYVSLSEPDLDLIYSDKIQLGQFVYVSKLEFCSITAPMVPVLKGLKPVPKKRQACVGSPKELVTGELLRIVRGSSGGGFVPEMTKKKGGIKSGNGMSKEIRDRVGLGVDARRLSLDSARRVWNNNQTPKSKLGSSNVATGTLSSERPKPSRSVNSDKRALQKNEIPRKQPSFNTQSPLKSRNEISSAEAKGKPLKKDSKSPTGCTMPSCLVKVPLKLKTGLEQRIPWNALPPAINNLGKGTLSYRDSVITAAARGLEEAAAADSVIQCMQSFAELCETSQKVAPGPLVDRYLNLHCTMRRTAASVNSLLGNTQFESGSTATTERSAMSWVFAATQTNLSKFSLFDKAEKTGTAGSKCHYVVLQAGKEPDFENRLPPNKPSRSHNNVATNSDAKRLSSSSVQQFSAARKVVFKDDRSKTSGLNDTAVLAEKLLSYSCQWFLKYMEGLLNKGFGPCRVKKPEHAHLLSQLKRVNIWLDGLIGDKLEADGNIEELKRKIYRFLLDHVDSAVITKH